MVKAESIKSFFRVSPIAVIGVSRKKNHFSYMVYETMKAKGYKVIPVNPNNDKVLGDICYPDLKSIPDKVDRRRFDERDAVRKPQAALSESFPACP